MRSFLDGLLADVLAQTREADLYAGTGTHNYWVPEAIPYAQGSDHDVFLGLGIPSTMLGHDPDWTHHSSEDKIDKTDASEFRRVGAFASAAAYHLASISTLEERLRVEASGNSIHASEFAQRLGLDAWSLKDQAATRRNKINMPCLAREEAELKESSGLSPNKLVAPVCAFFDSAIIDKDQKGPHRLTLLPLDASAFANSSPEDAKWLAEQEARFASDSEGLATRPNFGLISFEAINFMDGHRSTAEIADLLSAEYLIDIDQAWVDRLVSILEEQKLVTK